MFLKKLNILLVAFICLSIVSAKANPPENCLETIQLNPGEGMTYEDTANFVSCIMYELHKRGLKECKDECYEKLSEDEKEKRNEQFVKTFGEIIEGERARRALQSLKLTKQSHRF